MAFELVKKPFQYCCLATKKVKRRSEPTKNELMRAMIQVCVDNALKFRFVLMNSWYASEENFDFIRSKGGHFIAPLKDNRLIALSEEDKQQERFVRVDELQIPPRCAVRGWLKGHSKEVLIARQVFKNRDDSTGILHLVCSDLEYDYDANTTPYKKRWQVAVLHNSLKSNANLAKSPTRTVRTQSNHVFRAIYATFKLQCLSLANKPNPFVLCRKLRINASRSAYAQLQVRRAAA